MKTSRGIAAASGAYILWGLLPVYWKTLKTVPAHEILCHRMSWSLVFMLLLMVGLGRLHRVLPLLREIRVLRTFAVSSALLAVNWLIYIWSVNSGYIVEASLGYYINPLVTVAFGVFFLKERLRSGQWAALVLAGSGVAYLTFVYGQFPWIALSLAMTFATYGLLHKKTTVASTEGLCLETLLFFFPAAAVLLWFEFKGTGAFFHAGTVPSLLMVGTGLVTTVPLLLFTYAAQKIPLSLLGILQYSAPTINLLLGIFLYNEGFPHTRMIGFMLVWSALALFMLEGVVSRARSKKGSC
jgi:chloramphenicol-sensitive protein RarD